jgi:hypothetical protein
MRQSFPILPQTNEIESVEKEIDIAQGREERYSADKNEVFHI